jgi:hypothetical protein
MWPECGEVSVHTLDVAFVDMILEQIDETKGLHVITGHHRGHGRKPN